MSEALFGVGGLRWWEEDEILVREQAVQSVLLALRNALHGQNTAWTFPRVEGPLITPRTFISSAYDDSDIFALSAKLGDVEAALRAETTASSFLYAEKKIKAGDFKAPVGIVQVGKSFRRETNDGARASELRFNEFYQMEIQCIYKDNTKADIRSVVEPAMAQVIKNITRSNDVRLIPSDRLPAYSLQTTDVEVPYGTTVEYVDTGYQGHQNIPQTVPKWKEMASISTRTDFPLEGYLVLEVAIGLDRLVAVEDANR